MQQQQTNISNIHILNTFPLEGIGETCLFITDANGISTQHLQYLPYGELFVEQRATANYFTPYKFSAKEKDEVAGMGSFGGDAVYIACVTLGIVPIQYNLDYAF